MLNATYLDFTSLLLFITGGGMHVLAMFFGFGKGKPEMVGLITLIVGLCDAIGSALMIIWDKQLMIAVLFLLFGVAFIIAGLKQ
jgi:hypothetical protein